DLRFVHSRWQQGIEGWRCHVFSQFREGSDVAHTVLDRPLFRAGETVSMKHFLRAENSAGFALVSEGERPTEVSIRHQGSDQYYELPLTWDANGIAESTWTIPKQAKLGSYEIDLRRP